MTTRADAAVARLARRQHGLVTLEQAQAAGLTRRQATDRVAAGRWSRPRPRVYAIEGTPPSFEQSVMGACLAGGPGVFASHRTAARLWRLKIGALSHAIDVVAFGRSRPRLDGVRVHHTRIFQSADESRVGGVPVTSPTRTLIDLGDGLTIVHLGEAVDDAVRRRLTSLGQLEHGLTAVAGGRRALGPMRHILAARLEGYDPGESELEARAVRALRRAGMPAPVQQHRVSLGRRRCRIDLAYPERRLAIEIDGWSVHGSRRAFDDDRARANELVAAGWRLVRFTSATTDDELVDMVGRLLAMAV